MTGGNCYEKCLDVDLLKLIHASKVADWRHKNYAGRNVVQDFAFHLHPDELAAILDELTDEEFVECCTPIIWGAIERLTEAKVERLVKLCPLETVEKCLIAWVHVTTVLTRQFEIEYKGPSKDILNRMIVEALLQPRDCNFLLNYYFHFPDDQYEPYVHLLYEKSPQAATNALILIKAAKGDKVATEWMNTKNALGEDYLAYMNRAEPLAKPHSHPRLVLNPEDGSDSTTTAAEERPKESSSSD